RLNFGSRDTCTTLPDSIVNLSYTAVKIDSLRVVGPGANQFKVLVSIDGSEVTRTKPLSYLLQYCPTDTLCDTTAYLEVFFQNQYRGIRLAGCGLAKPNTSPKWHGPDGVDFGDVTVGQTRDTVVFLHNVSSAGIRVDTVGLLSPFQNVGFSVV